MIGSPTARRLPHLRRGPQLCHTSRESDGRPAVRFSSTVFRMGGWPRPKTRCFNFLPSDTPIETGNQTTTQHEHTDLRSGKAQNVPRKRVSARLQVIRYRKPFLGRRTFVRQALPRGDPSPPVVSFFSDPPNSWQKNGSAKATPEDTQTRPRVCAAKRLFYFAPCCGQKASAPVEDAQRGI